MNLLTNRIKSFFISNRWRYFKGILAFIFINILQITIPKITGKLIDGIQAGQIAEKAVISYSLIIIIISLIIFSLNYLTRLQITGASLLFQYQIRNEMFSYLQKLSMKFFNKNTVGDIMALTVNDVTAVRMALGRGVNLIIDTFFLLILSVFIMGKTVNIKLTLIAFLPFPILTIIVISFGKIINKRFRRVQESFGAITGKVQENVSGIRVIKAFVQEEKEIENFQRINSLNYKINMDLVRVWGVFYPLIELVSSMSYLIVLFYGSILVLRKEITLGDFIAVNSYIGILVRPIRFVGMIVNLIQKGRASMERIEALFNEKSLFSEKLLKDDGYKKDREFNKDCKRNVNVDRFQGKVEFKNLTFSYNKGDKPILKDINLKLEPGKITAVIGKIGSGKSTLANLILRLYNTETRGQLIIDGVDISDIPVKLLRENIGYVPQDNFLFSQSIKDNISFSEHEYSMEEIEEAARISAVYDNIMDFPDKFDTLLGERGLNLSGGQKQRISIARAIIRKPSILILDDCLSAVDTNTERIIISELKEVMKDSACLVISHRISTIQYADEIVVLEKGIIIERGNHKELLGRKGEYYSIYEDQMLEGKL